MPSSSEFSISRNLEAQKAENKRKTEALEKIVEENYRPSIDEFANSPAHERHLRSDKKFVENSHRVFEHSEDDQYHPKAIEYLVQFSINHGDLFYDDENEDYSADSIWPTEFDDYSNRVDAAFFLRSQSFECPIAFDITTKSSKSDIREKILISTNDKNLGYPVGFTDIRYCRDEDGNLSWQTHVPKYCVGVDKYTIDDTLDHSSIPESGNLDFDPQKMALISFKILYEMSTQNKLFLTPLLDEYDDGNGALSEEEGQDMDRLGTIDLIAQTELRRLTKKLPPEIRLTLGPADENGEYDPDQVAKLFMGRHSNFKDKTFATIVQTTQRLQEDLDQSPYKISHLAELSFRAAFNKTILNKGFDEAERTTTQRSERFYNNRNNKESQITAPRTQTAHKVA